MDDNKPQHI